NWMLDVNLALIERNIELMLEFVGDHAGGNRTEHLAVLAGLDLDEADQFGNTLGQFRHGVKLMRFAFGAALLERFDVALVGLRHGNGQPLRDQKITGVAGRHFDLIGLAAETDDVAGENYFGFCHKLNKSFPFYKETGRAK